MSTQSSIFGKAFMAAICQVMRGEIQAMDAKTAGFLIRMTRRQTQNSSHVGLRAEPSKYDLTLALTEGDCSPNAFPALWRVPRLPSQL